MRTTPATRTKTKVRKVNPETSRFGTSASAQAPNTASPDAKRAPKTTRRTADRAIVRTIGHSRRRRDIAVRVRPSSGRPRSPASIQARGAATIAMSPRARVTAAAASTPATSMARRAIHTVERTTIRLPRASARIPLAIVQGWLRAALVRQTITPPATRVTSTARPIGWYGTVSAPSRPTASAAPRSPGCGSTRRSGQTSASGEDARGAAYARGAAGGTGEVGAVGTVVSSVGAVGRVGPAGAGAVPVCRGSTALIRAPLAPASVGTAAIVPPWSSQTQRAMARPRPVPPAASLPVPKRSKTASARSAGMPGPSSRTSRAQWSGSTAAARTRTRPPLGLCRPALSRRLATTWASRAGSASTVSASGSTTTSWATSRGVSRASATARARSSATMTGSLRRADCPASIRDRSSRSATRSLIRSVCARAAPRVVASGVVTPSTRFSSSACCAASGVRSSCETVAMSWRRWASAVARSPDIVLKVRASVPTSSREVAVTRWL